MAVPREVLPIERLRGLHDFPEKAPLGSAEEAVNVHLAFGGPSPRPGTGVLNRITQGANALVGKGLWPWRTVSGALYLVAGYVDAVTGSGYLLVMQSNGVGIASFNLSAIAGDIANGNVGGNYAAAENDPWGACVFQPAGLPFDAGYNALIVGTSAPRNAAVLGNDTTASLWALVQSNLPGNVNGFLCLPVTPLDRPGGGFPYWGNSGIAGADLGVPGTVLADDGGPYLGNSSRAVFNDRPLIGGRAVMSYRGRLVVARLNDGSNRSGLRFSNVGDLVVVQNHIDQGPDVIIPANLLRPVAWQGWPADNIVWLHDPDPSPITAMAVWRDFLVVCKSNSLHLCRFSSIIDFTVLQQIIGVGAVGPGGIATVHHGGKDILFFVSGDGLYAFDGQVRYLSGKIERRFRRHASYLGGALVALHPWLNQLWIQVGESREKSATTSGQTPHWFVYDYAKDDWTEYFFGGVFDAATHLPFTGVPGAYEFPYMLARVPRPGGGGGAGLNVVVHGIGNVDTAHEAAGSSVGFETRWQSQRVAYGKHQVRLWRYLRLDQQETGEAANVTAYWMLDNQSRAAAIAAGQSTALSTIGANPGTFGTMTFGNATFGERGYISIRVPMGGGPARWFRFGVQTDQGTAGPPPYLFNAAEIDTRRKEGRR